MLNTINTDNNNIRQQLRTSYFSAGVKEEFKPKPPPMDYTTTFTGDFSKGTSYSNDIPHQLYYHMCM